MVKSAEWNQHKHLLHLKVPGSSLTMTSLLN